MTYSILPRPSSDLTYIYTQIVNRPAAYAIYTRKNDSTNAYYTNTWSCALLPKEPGTNGKQIEAQKTYRLSHLLKHSGNASLSDFIPPLGTKSETKGRCCLLGKFVSLGTLVEQLLLFLVPALQNPRLLQIFPPTHSEARFADIARFAPKLLSVCQTRRTVAIVGFETIERSPCGNPGDVHVSFFSRFSDC